MQLPAHGDPEDDPEHRDPVHGDPDQGAAPEDEAVEQVAFPEAPRWDARTDDLDALDALDDPDDPDPDDPDDLHDPDDPDDLHDPDDRGPEPVALDAVLTGITDLAATLDVIHSQTRDAVRMQRRHADHVDELHAENQRLRKGELATALAPMVRDVIRLHDEVAKLAAVAVPEAAEDAALVGARILDLLARWGVTSFAPATGATFDAAAHQGTGRVEDPDAADGTVAQVLRPGFRDADDRVIRPAEVAVVRRPTLPARDDRPDAAVGQVE